MIKSGTASPVPAVGVHLRSPRQPRGLTLERAAGAAGIGLVTLSRWEAGAHQPRLPELEALLHALQADARERLGERAGLCPPPGAGDLLRARCGGGGASARRRLPPRWG